MTDDGALPKSEARARSSGFWTSLYGSIYLAVLSARCTCLTCNAPLTLDILSHRGHRRDGNAPVDLEKKMIQVRSAVCEAYV